MRPGFVLSRQLTREKLSLFSFFVTIEMLKSDSCILINLYSNKFHTKSCDHISFVFFLIMKKKTAVKLKMI